jgi:peptide/nickel transport system substrate-binding protein
VPGDHATLVRNDAYYGAVPIIDEYIVAVYPDDSSAAEALKAGEIDAADLVPLARVAELRAAEGVAVATYDSGWFSSFFYNLDPARTTLFQDRLVREALFVALERQALVEAVYLGFGEVAQGTQPPTSLAYAPDRAIPVYVYDLARAKELLAQAGWSDTDGDGIVDKDGQPFAFEMVYREGNADFEQMLPAVQEAWREIGVAMTPKPIPFSMLAEILWGATYDFEMAAINQWTAPSGSQSFLFRCDSYANWDNAMRYCNPAYDTLDDQQKRDLDPARRRELLIEMSNIVWNDLPMDIVAFRDDRAGYRTRLHNVHPNGWGGPLWSLPWIWVES